ncbi:hypothetical protein J6590_084868 [Homalodisca vitripennis]|nr:hypothetical protein J6590_084868 [Homalodisca vitripennis]
MCMLILAPIHLHLSLRSYVISFWTPGVQASRRCTNRKGNGANFNIHIESTFSSIAALCVDKRFVSTIFVFILLTIQVIAITARFRQGHHDEEQ